MVMVDDVPVLLIVQPVPIVQDVGIVGLEELVVSVVGVLGEKAFLAQDIPHIKRKSVLTPEHTTIAIIHLSAFILHQEKGLRFIIMKQMFL